MPAMRAAGDVEEGAVLKIDVNLTNEECAGLEENAERVEGTLAKRMAAADAKRSEPATNAYVAFRKLMRPVREHLERLRGGS